MSLLRRIKPTLGYRIRRDKISDLRELLEIEQRQWGPRFRQVYNSGTPTAGLGFTGVVVPNNEVVTSPASTTSTAETCLYTLASSGANTWMYIPPGNFRAPQSWRIWAGGVYTTTATTQTFTWTTRFGSAANASANASFPVVTGAMAPGSAAVQGSVATAVPWWYEGHATIRGVGTTGSIVALAEIEMANGSIPTNSITGWMGSQSNSNAFDATQGAFWCLDVATSTTSAAVQLTQFMIVAWD